MTLATTRPEQERHNYNFLTVFNNAKNPVAIEDAPEVIQENTFEGVLINVLSKSQVLSIASFTVVPAGKLFVSSKYRITVKLTEEFANNFVLIRGLFEFSRPKNIIISSAVKDQSFEIEILEAQAESFLSYIETIVGWLVNEIKFKNALKAILKFENRIKQEQAILYSGLHASRL
jgi:hypothetical protein